MLTLLVVPAAYLYIDRFRLWSKSGMKRLFGSRSKEDFAVANGHDGARAHLE
jgi:hypothetical protein